MITDAGMYSGYQECFVIENGCNIVYKKSVFQYLLDELSIVSKYIKTNEIKNDYTSMAFHLSRMSCFKCTIKQAQDGNLSEENINIIHNALKAIQFAYSDNFNFTRDNLFRLNKLFLNKINCSDKNIVRINNVPGFKRYSKPMYDLINNKRVVDELDRFIEYVDKSDENIFIKAILIQFVLLYISVFKDGNCRVARLCMNAYLCKNGFSYYNVNIFKKMASDFTPYFKAFVKAESHVICNNIKFLDITDFIYLTCKYYMKSLSEILKAQHGLLAVDFVLYDYLVTNNYIKNINNDFLYNLGNHEIRRYGTDIMNSMKRLVNVGYFIKENINHRVSYNANMSKY